MCNLLKALFHPERLNNQKFPTQIFDFLTTFNDQILCSMFYPFLPMYILKKRIDLNLGKKVLVKEFDLGKNK